MPLLHSLLLRLGLSFWSLESTAMDGYCCSPILFQEYQHHYQKLLSLSKICVNLSLGQHQLCKEDFGFGILFQHTSASTIIYCFVMVP